MRKQTLGFALLVLLGLGACSDTTDDGVDATPPVLGVDTTGDQADTIALYRENCATCHEGGVDKAPHTQMIGLMPPESIVRTLTSGLMVEEAEGLSKDQKVALAEFLSGRKIGDPSLFVNPVCEAEMATPNLAAPPKTENWGLQRTNTRLIPKGEAGITKKTVQNLSLKWAFAFPGANRARSQPTVAGDTVFVGSHDGQVYALDKESGCIRWAFQASAEIRTGIVLDPWRADDPDAAPRAYFGDILGNIYAIDSRDGTQVWRKRPDEQPNITITGTPTLFEGKLYVPISSLEVVPATFADYECCTFRGSVIAYDAASGEALWQAFTIDTVATPQGENRDGTTQYGPSGAGIWNSPAIDAKRRQLYVGTSENYSSPPTLTSDAIIAFDLDTGARKWAFQATPNDAWNQSCVMPDPVNCPKENGPDYDFGAAIMMVSASNGVDYVIGGQKSGVVHALNPDTGAVLWQNQVGRGGTQGGIHFGMAATGDTLYIPISDMLDGRDYEMPERPGLYALDVKTGDFVWQSPYDGSCDGKKFCHPGISAAITATPDLVLTGAMDGAFRIHDAAKGDILWEHDTTQPLTTLSGEVASGGSIGGGAGPILSGNMLFVSSGYGIYLHMPGNVLLAFEAAAD